MASRRREETSVSICAAAADPKCGRENTSAAVADLGDDLLIQIFSRLPTRPLFQCRSLSKRCCELIDSYVYPPLARRGALSVIFFSGSVWVDGNVRMVSGHALIPPSSLSSGEGEHEGEDHRLRGADMTLSFLLRGYPRDHIVGCCNGLLLLDPGEQGDFVVCNPTTRRWVAVPKPTNSHQHSTSAALAFDPQLSPFFTIARLGTSAARFHGHAVKRLSVFRSDKGRWQDLGVYDGRALRGLAPGNLLMFGYGAMACDGALFVPEGSYRFVARFDLVTGVCTTIGYPQASDDWPEVVYAGVARGRVHLARMLGSRFQVLQVWALQKKNWRGGGDDEGWWEKKHQIDALALLVAWMEARGEKISPKQRHYGFLGFHPYLEDVVFLVSMNKIIACDLLRKGLEVVCDLGEQEINLCSERFFPYASCLLGCREDR